MRKFLNLMVLITVISSFLGSCTVEKRLYSNGYYVQWKHSYHGSSEASTEIAKEDPTALHNENTQNEPALIEESTAVNDDAARETIVTPSTLTIENNATVAEHEIEIELENGNSDAPNFTGQLHPVRVKSKSTQINKLLMKKPSKSDSKSTGGPNKGLLIVLCFLIPWLAVGLATNWDVKTVVFNLLWSLTCIGGIIHAIIVVNREA